MTSPFPYDGPEPLREPVVAALQRVVDPELSLSVVDAGLIYGVTIAGEQARVLLTMTSAACPVIDVIVDEVDLELGRALPDGTEITIELTWEPPWSADRMSERAKRFMGW